tara:strand:- start:1444 stop:2196 length:753 start_codon:yes stop_codon:yes gene_type:complete
MGAKKRKDRATGSLNPPTNTAKRKRSESGGGSWPPPKKTMYSHIEFKDMEVHVPPEVYGGLVETYPSRCPIVTAYALRPYVEGKVFCDLGCGGGDLTWVLSEWAATSIGIEYMWSRSKHWDSLGPDRENVQFIQADYFEAEIPVADVYFYWGLPEFLPRVVGLLTEKAAGSLLVGGARNSFLSFEDTYKTAGVLPKRTKRGFLLENVDRCGGYVLRMPVKETIVKGNQSVDGGDWDQDDLWCLCLIPLVV